MHIVAKETGFITATGVVGGTIPLALGAAFAAKERKKHQVAVVFFGDGAGQAGPFHESLNIASLWQVTGDLRLREQRLRRVHAAVGAHENRTLGAACEDLRDSRQHRRRQRSLRRARSDDAKPSTNAAPAKDRFSSNA